MRTATATGTAAAATQRDAVPIVRGYMLEAERPALTPAV